MFSVQLTSCELLFSGSGWIMDGLRLRWIIKAAFRTMRVNQVLRAERPSKLRKWRYPERKAFWTVSSASSLLRRMPWAIATNFERDATNISSKSSLRMTSARVSTTVWASKLGDWQEADRTLFFLVLKMDK